MVQITMMTKQENILIQVRPDHKFHYASEWDPRQHAHTKGGYLEGKIQLPKNMGDLRIVLSTVSTKPLNLNKQFIEKHPECLQIHPAIVSVVRIGRG